MSSCKDNVLAERIFSDLNTILDRLQLTEFTIIPTAEDYRCNKSPVIVKESKLALESWCLRLLFLYSNSHLLGRKKFWFENNQFVLLSNHSRLLVLLNPDHSTAWNVRRTLVTEEYLEPWDELKLNNLAMTRKPKSDDIFTYRQWLIEYLKKFKFQQLNDIVIEEEFQFCTKAYDQYNRNYYAWTYAMWLTCNFCRHRFDVLKRQLNLSKVWIESHISDYSCYHYRQLLLDCFCSITGSTIVGEISYPYLEGADAFDSCVDEQTLSIFKDIRLGQYSWIPILINEVCWLDQLMSTFTIRESFLLHRRFILSSIKNLTQDDPELSTAWASMVTRERGFISKLKDSPTTGDADKVLKSLIMKYIEAMARIEPKMCD